MTHPNVWTGLNTNNYNKSSELSRKWREAKEVNKAQAAKINEANLMQRIMTEVQERLEHHRACLTTSRKVLTKCLVRLWGQPSSKEQRQATGTDQDDELSLSLGRAKREREGVRQVLEQTYTRITQANKTVTNQEVGESTSKTNITTGNSELVRREVSAASAALLNATPHKHVNKFIRKSDIAKPKHGMWQGKRKNKSKHRSYSCTRTSERLRKTSSSQKTSPTALLETRTGALLTFEQASEV